MGWTRALRENLVRCHLCLKSFGVPTIVGNVHLSYAFHWIVLSTVQLRRKSLRPQTAWCVMGISIRQTWPQELSYSIFSPTNFGHSVPYAAGNEFSFLLPSDEVICIWWSYINACCASHIADRSIPRILEPVYVFHVFVIHVVNTFTPLRHCTHWMLEYVIVYDWRGPRFAWRYKSLFSGTIG